MNERTIKQGDYILITDIMDKNRYLKIGEVTNIETYPDGDVREYIVRFGFLYDIGVEDLELYKYDLPEKCRVLMFENR